MKSTSSCAVSNAERFRSLLNSARCWQEKHPPSSIFIFLLSLVIPLARTTWQIARDTGIIANGNRARGPAGFHRRKQFWIPDNLVHKLDERLAYILPCLRTGLAEFCPMLGGQRLALFPGDNPRTVRLVELGPNLHRGQFYVPERTSSRDAIDCLPSTGQRWRRCSSRLPQTTSPETRSLPCWRCRRRV